MDAGNKEVIILTNSLFPPRKFAMNKRFRGFKTSMISPGYNLRAIYLPAGTPGTRATR